MNGADVAAIRCTVSRAGQDRQREIMSVWFHFASVDAVDATASPPSYHFFKLGSPFAQRPTQRPIGGNSAGILTRPVLHTILNVRQDDDVGIVWYVAAEELLRLQKIRHGVKCFYQFARVRSLGGIFQSASQPFFARGAKVLLVLIGKSN